MRYTTDARDRAARAFYEWRQTQGNASANISFEAALLRDDVEYRLSNEMADRLLGAALNTPWPANRPGITTVYH